MRCRPRPGQRARECARRPGRRNLGPAADGAGTCRCLRRARGRAACGASRIACRTLAGAVSEAARHRTAGLPTGPAGRATATALAKLEWAWPRLGMLSGARTSTAADSSSRRTRQPLPRPALAPRAGAALPAKPGRAPARRRQGPARHRTHGACPGWQGREKARFRRPVGDGLWTCCERPTQRRWRLCARPRCSVNERRPSW